MIRPYQPIDLPVIMAGPAVSVEKTGGPKDKFDEKILAKLRQAMADHGLDALLVVRDQNVCWMTHSWDWSVKGSGAFLLGRLGLFW